MKNWSQVIQTSECKEFLRGLEEDSTENIQLRKMMEIRKRMLDDEVPQPPGWDKMQLYKSFLCTWPTFPKTTADIYCNQ